MRFLATCEPWPHVSTHGGPHGACCRLPRHGVFRTSPLRVFVQLTITVRPPRSAQPLFPFSCVSWYNLLHTPNRGEEKSRQEVEVTCQAEPLSRIPSRMRKPLASHRRCSLTPNRRGPNRLSFDATWPGSRLSGGDPHGHTQWARPLGQESVTPELPGRATSAH